jgi:hypothetical protein
VYDIFYDFGDKKGAITFMNFSVKLSKKEANVVKKLD